jgi:hypothetical protein
MERQELEYYYGKLSLEENKNIFSKGDLVEVFWEGKIVKAKVVKIEKNRAKVRLLKPVLYEKKSIFNQRHFFGEEKILRKKFSDELRIFEVTLNLSLIRKASKDLQ